jgi:hypothetical protein
MSTVDTDIFSIAGKANVSCRYKYLFYSWKRLMSAVDTDFFSIAGKANVSCRYNKYLVYSWKS